ncbi:MAG: hypothetical protein HQ494_02260 [Rhodospirillales bacterium]|nr:hypothetical protein [Rhodospirillales bacterium]
MKFAAFGRTRVLHDSILAAIEAGHELTLVGTCKAESEYDVDEGDFARLAEKFGCPFFNSADINDPRQIEQARIAGADVAISVNWLTVVGSEMRSLFRHGVLNGHAGDLPRFRGNACPNWAILTGEPKVTVTIHQMGDGIDDGPIFLKRAMPLEHSTYIEDVYSFLNRETPQMFIEVIEGIAANTLRAQAQPENPDLALRCYPRRPEDGKINWDAPVEHIHRLVRASSRPFAGAFTTLEGREKVIIWRADIVQHPGAFVAVPGQVSYCLDDDPVIAAADGMLRLTEIEVTGTSDGAEAKAKICGSLRNRLV